MKIIYLTLFLLLNASVTSSSARDMTIVDDMLGCINYELYSIIARSAALGRTDEANMLMKRGIGSGECIMFKKNERVEHVATTKYLYKIKRKNNEAIYWIIREEVK